MLGCNGSLVPGYEITTDPESFYIPENMAEDTAENQQPIAAGVGPDITGGNVFATLAFGALVIGVLMTVFGKK